jgi:hypothetical protein
LPLAFELLHHDPFTAGDHYEGDLLAMILRIDAAFWRDHSELHQLAADIATLAFSRLAMLDENVLTTTRESLTEAYTVFKRA